MKDYIVRATAAEGQVRAFASTTQSLLQHAREIHYTSPVASAALGRTLTAAGMMGAMLKGEKDLLTITIRGNGPLEGITVTADQHANVKGYVFNPSADLPANAKGKIDVAGGIGLGFMNIIKDIGLKEPYVGQTHLVTSEIGDDLTHYFYHSEQTPSVVALGVHVDKDTNIDAAGGFIIQLMPNAEEKVIAHLEEKLAGITSVTSLLKEGHTPESILELLLGDLDVKINDKIETKFECNCSRERMERALISVGKKELTEMIEEGKDIEMNCHFCNQNHVFTPKNMEELRDNL